MPLRPSILLPLLAIAAVLLAWPVRAPLAGEANRQFPQEYNQFVHPTVLRPVKDAISLNVPPILSRHPMAPMGILDVTRPPFSADPTGRRDATAALQRAIDYARDRQMVCYFPTGTYLVSDTLYCRQNYYRRVNGYTFGAREHPCLLVGSHAGARPVIRLRDHSPGFNEPGKPKCVVRFEARKVSRQGLFPDEISQHINMNQMFAGIDIVIGAGNAGAIGIHHWSAQGSGVQDCRIDATNGLIGLQGGAGAGGGHANITIQGGRIGMDLTHADPCPVITGITLTGQTEHALVYNGMCALTAVGLHIVSGAPGPLLVGRSSVNYPENGPVNLVDSIIEMRSGTALAVERSLYMRNVYVKGASTIVAAGDAGPDLAGAPDGWVRVEEYALGLNAGRNPGPTYVGAIYEDGVRSTAQILADVAPSGPPPSDLVAGHLWPSDFPWFDSPGVVNVKEPPYLAAGDGVRDDTQAIQRALDENRTVLLPKGFYRISGTIRLGKDNALLGVGRHLSRLLVRPGEAHFDAPGSPRPALATADSPATTTVLANLGIHVQREARGAYALDWLCGGKAVMRNFNLYFASQQGSAIPPDLPKARFPLAVISGHGGGSIHGFIREDSLRQEPGYRHLLIRDTPGPLRIYQLDVEHARSDAEVEIANAQHVTIFGMKTEANHRALWVRNSKNIEVIGFGGKAAALPGKTLITVEASSPFTLSNAMDVPYVSGGSRESMFGMGVPPEQWHMLEDLPSQGPAVRTMPLDRPVLYRRR